MENEELKNILLNSEESLEFDVIRREVAKKTISPMGRALAMEMRPSDSPEIIKSRLDFSSQCKAIIENEAHIPIYGLSDVEPLLKKGGVKGSAFAPEELLELCKNADIAALVRAFVNMRKLDYPLIMSRLRDLENLSVFSKIVKSKINDDGSIDDKASPELRQIRNEMRVQAGRLRKRLGQILDFAAKKGFTQDDLITIKEGRFVIPLKEEYRKEVKGIIHHRSASGATAFVEPLEVYEMNNGLTSLEIDEQHEIHKILQELTLYAFNHWAQFVRNQQILTDFDFELAKAYYAISIKAGQPVVSTDDKMFLLDARHPILIKQLEYDNVVPLDLELGGEYCALIITGPNSGGKTVALKTLGLLSLMMQSGLLIPAHPDSSLPVFKNIFSDIGDAQSIQENLSTFSSHMKNMKAIVNNVTAKDLVLLDEIGTGTDPQAGSALAIAIFEKFIDTGNLTVATTHHSALKIFAQGNSKIENASMAFDLDSLESTYKLRLRIPGSSYAIEISKRLGLKNEIIDRASELLGKDELEMESLIKDLREKVEQLEQELRSSTLKRAEYEGLVKLYGREMEKLSKEKKSFKKEAAENLRDILDKANKRIERAVLEIRSTSASSESIKKSKEVLQKQKSKLQQLEKEAAVRNRELKKVTFSPGDIVNIPEYREKGKVLSEIAKDGRIRIDVNGITLQIDAGKLEKAESQEKSEQVVVDSSPIIHVDPEVDVRGMYGDEAVETVKEYLNDAVAGNLKKVTIIHGKGKGILQKRIHSFLPSDKRIVSYRLGAWGEGDTGVTIVELK